MIGIQAERFIYLGGVLFLTSCATISTVPYDTLNASTQAVQAASGETYTRFLKLEHKQDVLSAAVTGIGAAPDIRLTTFDPLTEKNTTYRQELEKREAALDILADYAKLLAALAKTDEQADVDAAATQLTSSVQSFGQSLDATWLNNSNEKQVVALLGTFVSELGGLIADHEREVALKQIMLAAQPWIGRLTDLLRHDNAQLETATLDLLLLDAPVKKADGQGKSIVGQDRGLLADYNLLLQSAQGMDRLTLTREAADTIVEAREIKLALIAMNEALAKIPPAHQQILDSLNKKSGSLAALTELMAEAQHANNFYQSLDQ